MTSLDIYELIRNSLIANKIRFESKWDSIRFSSKFVILGDGAAYTVTITKEEL